MTSVLEAIDDGGAVVISPHAHDIPLVVFSLVVISYRAPDLSGEGAGNVPEICRHTGHGPHAGVVGATSAEDTDPGVVHIEVRGAVENVA